MRHFWRKLLGLLIVAQGLLLILLPLEPPFYLLPFAFAGAFIVFVLTRMHRQKNADLRAVDSLPPQVAVRDEINVVMPPLYFPLDAVFFAVAHFSRLACADGRYLTEESLRDAYWYGGYDGHGRRCLQYLLKSLPRLGVERARRKETTFVGGSGWAMPVVFDKSVYAYSTAELVKAMSVLAHEGAQAAEISQ